MNDNLYQELLINRDLTSVFEDAHIADLIELEVALKKVVKDPTDVDFMSEDQRTVAHLVLGWIEEYRDTQLED